MNLTNDEIKHLEFIRDRLISIYGNSPNTDYVLEFSRIITKLKIEANNIALLTCSICNASANFFFEDSFDMPDEFREFMTSHKVHCSAKTFTILIKQ